MDRNCITAPVKAWMTSGATTQVYESTERYLKLTVTKTEDRQGMLLHTENAFANQGRVT